MNYTIKQGKHYAQPLELIKKFCGIRLADYRVMRGDVVFSSNCKYDIGVEQSDINKLFGFSCGCRHHNNSVRVGWRYVPSVGKIELVSYVYRNKVRLPEKHIQWCEFNEKYSVTIYTTDKYVKFFCNNIEVAENLEVKGISYPLSLYFGGNMTAPHDMNIKLNVDYK